MTTTIQMRFTKDVHLLKPYSYGPYIMEQFTYVLLEA